MQTAALSMQVTNSGIHFLAFTEYKGELRKAWRGRAQEWNMSSIPRETAHFRIPIGQDEKYYQVLQSKEGKVVVNNLKNRKTNELINNYLQEELKKYEQYFEQNKNLNPELHIALHLTKELIAEPLVGNNQIAHHKLHITKEDIYNEFLKEGLLN